MNYHTTTILRTTYYKLTKTKTTFILNTNEKDILFGYRSQQ